MGTDIESVLEEPLQKIVNIAYYFENKIEPDSKKDNDFYKRKWDYVLREMGWK